jgi:hypothetical protein
LRESLTKAIERIGAKMADTVRIDTTHFVTTEGRGLPWEKAVEMNIPVVRPEWVEGCERGGRIVGVRQYYLDADPRQRQVVQAEVPQQSPAPAEPAREPLASPAAETHTNGGSQAVPPTPPAKDTPKAEGHNDEDDEESDGEGEKAKTTVPDEQKVRVEDRDQHKVALRPAAAPEPEETEKEKEPAEEGSGSGSQTPGHSSFQDVAL